MKKMLCPQCKIAAMYVKNAAGERLLVYVTDQGEVVPKDPSQSFEGFDVSEVFCLGCSWMLLAWFSQASGTLLMCGKGNLYR